MAIPANVTSVVVLGTFLTPEGNPSTGTVTFTPSRWLTNSGANVSIPNSSVTVTLGTAGEFEVTLPATDDTDNQPGNWYYVVSEIVDGVSQSYNLLLPGTAGSNGTAFLADLAPAVELGPEYASTRGPAGEAATVTVGTVSSVADGGTASVTNSGTTSAAILDFVLVDGPTGPQGATGATGPTGPQGSAATVEVGTVSSVADGGTASVTNSGTSGSAVLDFVLVDGPTGPTGATGPQGAAATVEVGTVTTGTAGGSASVTNSGTSGSAVLDFIIPRGDTGETGATGPQGSAASITVGTVTSVAFGGTASVTNSGTSGSAVLDFVLVTGPQGDLAGLSANQPLDYTSNTFSLLYGAGLGTATGGTLVADLSSATPAALGTAAAGTAVQIARADHVHAMPSAADTGAVGTATAITAGTGLAGGGDLSTSRTLDVVFSDSAAAALGTAAAGTATTASRSDHVHGEQDLSGLVSKSVVTAKGDLIVASGSGAVNNLPVGANDTIAVADSGETLGIKWSATLAGLTLTAPNVTRGALTSPIEKVTVSATAATGTVAFDAATQGVLYYTTDASGNWTLNVRGDSGTTLNSILAIGDSFTVAFLVTNGATPYYQTGFQVDGSSVTPKWIGGSAPTAGNASSVDIYTISIIKTANATFTAFAGVTKAA